jgi:transposase
MSDRIKEKLDLRLAMFNEYKKGATVGTATKNIRDVYLDRAPSQWTVKKWFGRFRKGEYDPFDRPRSGRPPRIDDDIICELMRENPEMSTKEIADRLNIDNSTAFRRLKKLGFKSTDTAVENEGDRMYNVVKKIR